MNKLALYLEKSGSTQEEFAARVGVGQPTISRLVRGGMPGWSLAARIVKETDGEVAIDDWVTGRMMHAVDNPSVTPSQPALLDSPQAIARIAQTGADASPVNHNSTSPAAVIAPGQDASGRRDGGVAAPDRNSVTVNGRLEAGGKTGTVEPAAGPAESRLAAAGRHTPADDPAFGSPG